MNMDMGDMMDQMMRMMPMMGREGTATANAYFAVTGVVGIVAWGITAIAYQFLTPVTDAGVREVSITGWAGIVTFGWMGVVGLRMLMAQVGVKKGVQFSSVALVWIGSVVMAFMANVAGFFVASPLKEGLMWLPWFAAFGIAYTATGVMVERGGVYLVAGLVSLAGLVVGTGVLGVGGWGPTQPFPLPFVILGLLHSVPMLIDAARGGRQLTDQGVPAVQFDGDGETEDVGGVVQT